MSEFLIKKLQLQELAYSNNIPGARGGQYFLMSKNHINFFPPLKKEIHNHLQIINIVRHDSVAPSQAKYVYNNDKFHGSTANSPRNEHRININLNINPDREVFLKDDIIIFKKEVFKNENEEDELAYVTTRFRKSLDSEDYEYLTNLLNQGNSNYFSANSDDLQPLKKYRKRLFSRTMSLEPIIPQIDHTLINIKQSSKEADDNENRAYENQIKRLVFSKYNYQCLITGIGFHWKELGEIKHSWRGITGAHIKPRAHDGPYSSDNIIPLLEPVHQLFDKGIFTFNDDMSIRSHNKALDQTSLSNFHEYNSKKLKLPGGINISREYIKHHRDHVYGNFLTGSQIRRIS